MSDDYEPLVANETIHSVRIMRGNRTVDLTLKSDREILDLVECSNAFQKAGHAFVKLDIQAASIVRSLSALHTGLVSLIFGVPKEEFKTTEKRSSKEKPDVIVQGERVGLREEDFDKPVIPAFNPDGDN